MAFGGPRLLDGVSFQIEEGQRVAIVGRNGEGKSTLLRLLSGDLVPDVGTVTHRPGLRLARLSQKVPEAVTGTVGQIAAQGLGALGGVLEEYRALARAPSDPAALVRLAGLEHALEQSGGWESLRVLETVLSRLGLDPSRRIEELSGGLKRRALLARALVADPDVLLLDEPTNHLDIASIAWIEELLRRRGRTLIFITHDRMFLDHLATRILELDRGRLFDFPCDWDTFQKRRQARLENEEHVEREFDKKLAREEAWIRQGIKARRTRNEGRVRALEQMRRERAQRRERMGLAGMGIQEARQSGKIVVEAHGAGFAWGSRPAFAGLNAVILRGDRVGVIGPNGAGKTTLLQVLLGRLQPTEGSVRLGTRLEVAYFDQHREELDPNATVRQSVTNGVDTVTIDGRDRHVMGYLKEFLFPPERASTLVRLLSGGERNRLLLARLFTRPANLLVMDEPTNDLDAETLELLEDRLLAFSGTLIVVSHDRAFLNNVVSSTLALEPRPEGGSWVREYVGGYDDWLRQRPAPLLSPAEERQTPPRPAPASQNGHRKLGYKDQRELDALRESVPLWPERIEALETAVAEAQRSLADPGLYRRPPADQVAARDALAALEDEMERAFAHWEADEARLRELSPEG